MISDAYLFLLDLSFGRVAAESALWEIRAGLKGRVEAAIREDRARMRTNLAEALRQVKAADQTVSPHEYRTLSDLAGRLIPMSLSDKLMHVAEAGMASSRRWRCETLL